MLENILKDFESSLISPDEYSALTLAYIGDCVYELYVRTYLIKDANHNVNDLHKAATKFVCCKAQSELYYKIESLLTDKEAYVFKRGRNTKSHVPKNADMKDYRNATGVEALIGYLYLSRDYDRITELLRHIFD